MRGWAGDGGERMDRLLLFPVGSTLRYPGGGSLVMRSWFPFPPSVSFPEPFDTSVGFFYTHRLWIFCIFIPLFRYIHTHLVL